MILRILHETYLEVDTIRISLFIMALIFLLITIYTVDEYQDLN